MDKDKLLTDFELLSFSIGKYDTRTKEQVLIDEFIYIYGLDIRLFSRVGMIVKGRYFMMWYLKGRFNGTLQSVANCFVRKNGKDFTHDIVLHAIKTHNILLDKKFGNKKLAKKFNEIKNQLDKINPKTIIN